MESRAARSTQHAPLSEPALGCVPVFAGALLITLIDCAIRWRVTDLALRAESDTSRGTRSSWPLWLECRYLLRCKLGLAAGPGQ